MSVKLKPLGDRIVAEYEKTAAKTAGGIFLPAETREKSEFAKVVEIGENVKNLKVGDKIIFREYAAQDVKIGGEKFAIVKEEDVLAKMEEK